MDREKMIDTICNDIEDWLKRDRQECINHFDELERSYLKKLDDKALENIYESCI